MAKKTSEVLLQEVVGQLRQLNRSSVRDQLREAETAKRQESLMNQGEVQEEQQSTIIDAGMDFQRRFLAGQAKTFTDKTLQEKGAKFSLQEKQIDILQSLLLNSRSMTEDLYKLAGEIGPNSIEVHDISVVKGIGEVLKQDVLSTQEFEKLGKTVGDGLSDAAHISRGGVGYLSAPGRSNVDEDAFIKLADRVRKARLGESDEDENDLGEILQDAAGLGNLEDFMQGSKVKLTKDMLVERNLGDNEDANGLFSAEVVNAADPIGSKRGQRFLVPAGTDIFHPGGLADTNEVVLQGFDFAEVETKDGSLYAHDAPLLDYLKLRDNELDRQRNNDLRSQIENRREGGGMGQFGMLGAGAAGGPLGMEMLDAAEGGGFMGNMFKNIKKSPWLLAPLLFFSKVRTKLWAGAKLLFKPFAWMGGKFVNKKILSNPMNWRKLLVTGLVYSAAYAWDRAFDDETQGPHSDTFDNSDITLDPGSPGGNWFTNMSMLDKVIYGHIGYSLVKGGLKTRVGQVLQGMMKTAWGNLGRTSIGFWLLQAARSAGMLAVGTGAALISWPALLLVAATGVAWWQWDNLMDFFAEDEDELLKVTGAQPPGMSNGSLGGSLFNRFGIKKSGTGHLNDLIPGTGDLSLLDGDGSKVLTAVDQRRISNDTSNIITNHFHSNETIPFGWTGKQGFAPYVGN